MAAEPASDQSVGTIDTEPAPASSVPIGVLGAPTSYTPPHRAMTPGTEYHADPLENLRADLTQFRAGAESGGLGTGARALVRATGGVPEQFPQPHGIDQYTAHALGIVPAIAADYGLVKPVELATRGLMALAPGGQKVVQAVSGLANRFEEAVSPVAKTVRKIPYAGPAAVGAVKGAPVGAAGGAGTQYADTGDVTLPGVGLGALFGSIVGAGIGGGVPLAVDAYKGTKHLIESSAAKTAAGQGVEPVSGQAPVTLQIQAPGQLASEVNPSMGPVVDQLTSTPSGQQQLAQVAQNRLGAAATQLGVAPTTDAVKLTTAAGKPGQAAIDQAALEQGATAAVENRTTTALAQHHGNVLAQHDQNVRNAAAKVASAEAALGPPVPLSETGSKIHQAATTTLETRKATREANIQPEKKAVDDAVAAQGGKPVDASGLLKFLQSDENLSNLTITDANGTPRKVGNYLAAGEPEPTPQILDAKGKPLSPSTPAPEGQIPYERLEPVINELQNAVRTSAAAPQKQRVFKQALALAQKAQDEYTGGASAAFRAKYAAESAPVNALMEGGRYGQMATEATQYTPKGTPVEQITPEANPKAIAQTFLRGDARGAQKLVDVMGPDAAEAAAKGHFSHLTQGENAAKVQDIIDKHAEALDHLPQTKQALVNLQKAKAAHEAAQDAETQAKKAVADEWKARQSEQAKAGKEAESTFQQKKAEAEKTMPPTGETAAHQYLVDLFTRGDKTALEDFNKKLVAAGTSRRDVSQMVKSVAMRHFADLYNAALRQTESAPGRLPQVSGPQLRKYLDEAQTQINSMLDTMTGTGFMSPGHAADIRRVTNDIQSLRDGLTTAKEEAKKFEPVEKLTAATRGTLPFGAGHIFGYVHPVRMVTPEVTQRVQNALFDPAEMHKLVTRLESARSLHQKMKVLSNSNLRDMVPWTMATQAAAGVAGIKVPERQKNMAPTGGVDYGSAVGDAPSPVDYGEASQ